MSQHGATLQTYNQELVKCLEDLKTKKRDLLEVVNREELEKKALEKDLQILKEKLSFINSNLQKHKALYDSYERTIQDTESGFKKILESSQMLLNLAQQEANKLQGAKKGPTANKILNEEGTQNSFRYD